ncbi:MAG: hypothetical protein A2W85_02125 [Bacteroidetes bacterium GWF2_41_31]|nr:MAG: hypothetical protein A2W85_02125 [Bacteroidetes bacterium GWF2_41_31]
MLKKLLSISVVVLLIGGMLALVGASYMKRSNQKVNKLVVRVCGNDGKGFLKKEDLEKTINTEGALLNYRLADFSEKSIEKKLKSNPYIDRVDCYLGLEGEVFVNVKERIPVVRVYEKNNQSYYLDENGILFPIGKNYAPRVMIANGYLGDLKQKQLNTVYDSAYFNTPLYDLFTLVSYIRKDAFLNAQIAQLYYNSIGEWELVPELGDHIIKFGSMANMDQKFENLRAFYQELSLRSGWNDYQIINLTFNNQIVCTKK